MSTNAHRAARNRANAQNSTGPRTLAGKARSAQNHFRHGLAGRFVLIPGEDPSEFTTLLRALEQEHQPATPTEHLLVERLAQHWWLTQRALRLQNDCFGAAASNVEESLTLFLRYQTTHERAFGRALNQLLQLRRERRHAETHVTRQALARQKQQSGFERQHAQQAASERRSLIDQVNLSIAKTKLRNVEIGCALASPHLAAGHPPEMAKPNTNFAA